MPATINNTIGKLTFTAQSLTGLGAGGVTGAAGVGYKFLEITFRSKASGVSDIHLTDVMLINSLGLKMPVQIVDAFTVVWGGVSYQNIIFTNSTGPRTKLHTHTFDFAEKQLSFNITYSRVLAPTGYCNVIIPKALLYAPPDQWIVMVNGATVTPIITEYAAQTSLYFTYNHIDGELQIKIIGTTVIGE